MGFLGTVILILKYPIIKKYCLSVLGLKNCNVVHDDLSISHLKRLSFFLYERFFEARMRYRDDPPFEAFILLSRKI